MKVELELPDLPEGHEYTGEFRKVELDEMYLDSQAHIPKVQVWPEKSASYWYYAIIRKIPPPWQPPEGVFKPGWIAIDEGGGVYWFEYKPKWHERANQWVIGKPYSDVGTLNNHLAIEFPSTGGPEAIWEIKESP